MAKKLIMITESYSTSQVYEQWLYEFFGQEIEVEAYSVERDRIDRTLPSADLYLVAATSSAAFRRVVSCIPAGGQVVISTITFRRREIEELKALPTGTRALLVNLSIQMAIETVAELNRLDITHIELIPYYPGAACPPDVQLAITPGEVQFVPPQVKRVIDLGHRVFTADTLTNIALKLGFRWFLKSGRYRRHVASLEDQGHSLVTLWNDSLRAENYLDILMGALSMGILGVDVEQEVFAANSVAEEMLRLRRGSAVGSPLAAVSLELYRSLEGENLRQECSKLIQLDGVYINLSTVPASWEGEAMGFFIILQRFTEEEERQHQFRRQLYDRGYKSKYVFDDILGHSPAMLQAKTIAQRMAGTDASILLTGESGTGKELFAHSIHNASPRRKMPFVAINCAALPESLLESELFGYNEGAFTGAKKGGKMGLFELAHRGTLFLDEIEGMSRPLQAKLLRVLQEREVMRVGGDRIIAIDVRIIAATNEDILERVRAGTFRKDLYYRLNTLPIGIPPLRDRGEDLFLIMDGMMRRLGATFTLSPQARAAFRAYTWDGNVRELGNIVEYLHLTGKQVIEAQDLPQYMLAVPGQARLEPAAQEEGSQAFLRAAAGREEAFRFVLGALAQASGGMGRGQLCLLAQQHGIPLTDQQARGILASLHQLGLASVSRGRGGSRITQKGSALWRELQI